MKVAKDEFYHDVKNYDDVDDEDQEIEVEYEEEEEEEEHEVAPKTVSFIP